MDKKEAIAKIKRLVAQHGQEIITDDELLFYAVAETINVQEQVKVWLFDRAFGVKVNIRSCDD